MSRTTNDAIEILHHRYIDSPERRLMLAQERIGLEAASLLRDMRKRAGLTQQQLAKLIGTEQSVISRMENLDYRSHTLGMLVKIADATGQRLSITAGPNP